MTKLVVAASAFTFAAALAQPAPAVTFPSLNTIYVASGVWDDGAADEAGVATSVHCSNVSGQNAQVRALVLGSSGLVAGSATTLTVPHGATQTFSTHGTSFSTEVILGTGFVGQGVLNVESTQSGVFCNAMIIPASTPQTGVALHMVRVNGHPGTEE